MKKTILITMVTLLFGCTMVFAQGKTKTKTILTNDTVLYSCPVHKEVRQEMPGKCPKCGATLVRKVKKSNETTCVKKDVMLNYTCPNHSEITSNKQDKCPKCENILVERK